ncbi:MAG: FAD-dependent oxidoreductase [Candidatus Parcubacteria bacterium]|nr:FAD-dependent oxidoreductase [Candidatus Parcubacteria bacterium]
MDKYNVIIVGAGPAGLFASYELLQQDRNLKVCLIDRGKSIKNRTSKEVMFGVGGSGAFSDGKLHYSLVLSHEKMLDIYPKEEYENILKYVDSIFTNFGVDADYYPKNLERVDELVEENKKSNIQLFVRKIRHVGSDKLPAVIGKFEEFLLGKNIDLKTETNVIDLIIENGQCEGVITEDGQKIFSKNVILAPGRLSASWLQDVARKYGIEFKYEPAVVGVRVEFPSLIMQKYADLMYEAIFSIYTPTFNDVVRTFCPCPQGHVAIETYKDYVCVNGHSNSNHDSANSNFALVSIINLTAPVENTISYAESIAKLANTIGGGKPLIQRLKDLHMGRRSTWERINESSVIPTLTDVTPGDISMALPARVTRNIIEGLEELEKVMPGINSGDTLLYAPEIKLRTSKIVTGRDLETKIKNLYIAGDGPGVSGNITGAAATGTIAARGIINSSI